MAATLTPSTSIGSSISSSFIPHISKSLLRTNILQTLFQTPLSNYQQECEILTNILLNSPIYKKSKNIAVYFSIFPEWDSSSFIYQCFKDKKKIYAPRLHNKHDMTFIYVPSYKEIHTYSRNQYHILEPNLSKNYSPFPLFDLIVIPGLAFSPHESNKYVRLGRGFYDRYLRYISSLYHRNLQPLPSLFSVALKKQFIDYIPYNRHDVLLDGLIYIK